MEKHIYTNHLWGGSPNKLYAKVFGQSKHIIHLWGGYPTNKNYDSDIFKKQSMLKLPRNKHTKN